MGGLETSQDNFYRIRGKASGAGYTCADTANSDRNQKRRWPSHPRLQHAFTRQALGDDERGSGGLNTSVTMIAYADSFQQLRHDYVDLTWSTAHKRLSRHPRAQKPSAPSPGVAGTGVRLLQRQSVRAASNTIVRSTLMTSVRQPLWDHWRQSGVYSVIKGVLSQRSAGGSNKRRS